MVEEILSLDEAKRIAKEYVQQKEQCEDVEVDGLLSSEGGVLLYAMQGKARKHTWTKDFDGVIAERSFKLQILAKGGNKGNIVGYLPSDWIGQPPLPPPPSWQPVEPIEPMPQIIDIFDSLGKKAKAAKDKAKARPYEEKAREIRDKRGKR